MGSDSRSNRPLQLSWALALALWTITRVASHCQRNLTRCYCCKSCPRHSRGRSQQLAVSETFGTSLAHLRLTSSLESAMSYLLPPKDPQLFVCFKNSRDLETHRRLFRGRVACNHSQSFRDALHSAKPASPLYRVDREASTILACEDSTGKMHFPLT